MRVHTCTRHDTRHHMLRQNTLRSEKDSKRQRGYTQRGGRERRWKGHESGTRSRHHVQNATSYCHLARPAQQHQ